MAGTVLVHKIAGAAAELSADDESLTLAKVAAIAQAAIDNTVTIGASLDHCNVPGREFQTNLKSNQMEIGMGIHNEPGVIKLDKIPTVEELVNNQLLPYLLDQDDEDRAYVPFSKSDKTILMVNNLGGLSNLEIQYIAQVSLDSLAHKYGIKPVRVAVGTFITALNGPGFSLTLLNASRANSKIDDKKIDILNLFDAPAAASGWTVVPFVSKEAKETAEAGQYNKEKDFEIPAKTRTPTFLLTPNGLQTSLRAALSTSSRKSQRLQSTTPLLATATAARPRFRRPGHLEGALHQACRHWPEP